MKLLQISRLTKRSKFTHNPRNIPIYPFFKVLEPDDYVDIMIQEVTKVLVFSDSYSPTVQILQVCVFDVVLYRSSSRMADLSLSQASRPERFLSLIVVDS